MSDETKKRVKIKQPEDVDGPFRLKIGESWYGLGPELSLTKEEKEGSKKDESKRNRSGSH